MGCGPSASPSARQGHHHGPAGQPGRSTGSVRLLRCPHLQKPSKFADDTVIGSPVQPAAAGVLRLLRRLCRGFLTLTLIGSAVRREDVSQRYRLLLHLGAAPHPSLVHRQQKGQRPWSAWCNSCSRDNAEHGLGAHRPRGPSARTLIRRSLGLPQFRQGIRRLKAAYEQFIATKNNTKANDTPKYDAAELEKAAAAGCEKSAEILKSKRTSPRVRLDLRRRQLGIRHRLRRPGSRLASGEDVSVMVFDTGMYSNTGGQASRLPTLVKSASSLLLVRRSARRACPRSL